MKKIKAYTTIILISLLFGIYIFEFYMTFGSGNVLSKKVKIYKKIQGNNYDTRTKFEIYKDLKKKDEQTVLGGFEHVSLSTDNLYSLSGISNAKTIVCNENGYYMIYTSDRFGFNNPDSEWEEKEIEFLLLGDSFVQGYCVNRPNDIGSNLRNISKKSVLNLGYGGNGPLTEFATLREYLGQNVKNVVWIYYGNDLIDLKNELNSETLKKYIKNKNFKQNLKLKVKDVNRQNKLAMEIEEKAIEEQTQDYKSLKYKILKFIRLHQTKRVIRKNFPSKKNQTIKNDEIYTAFKEILKLSKNLTEENGSRFFFVYLPAYPKYTLKESDVSYQKIKKIVKELEIFFIDIDREVFNKENDPLVLFPFKQYGHYNEKGYRKVSEAIYNSILRNGN